MSITSSEDAVGQDVDRLVRSALMAAGQIGAPSVGPKGFGICMIDEDAIDLAGNMPNAFLYAPQRVIDADLFYVKVE